MLRGTIDRLRGLKQNSKEIAEERNPTQKGTPLFETLRRRDAAQEKRDTYLDSVTSSLESTEQDPKEQRLIILESTLFDMLKIFVSEYSIDEMSNDIIERLKEKLVAGIAFAETPRDANENQIKKIEGKIKREVEDLFSQEKIIQKINQTIETLYKTSAQNIILAYRELNPGPISDKQAQSAFNDLLEDAARQMIPKQYMEQHRERVLKEWHEEYTNLERNLAVLEKELDYESAEELKSILTIPNTRVFLFRVREYNRFLSSKYVDEKARDAWRIILFDEVKKRFGTLVDSIDSLHDQIGDAQSERSQIKLKGDEFQKLSTEEKRDYDRTMAALKIKVRQCERAYLEKERLLLVSRDVLHDEYMAALGETDLEQATHIWEQFLRDGEAYEREWLEANSTLRQSFEYIRPDDQLPVYSTQRIPDKPEPEWLRFFAHGNHKGRDLSIEKELERPTAQPTYIPEHLKPKPETTEVKTRAAA